MKNWVMVPNRGDWVTADHPITVSNPDKYFQVYERRFDCDKIWIRGENTMWFNLNMISPKSDK